MPDRPDDDASAHAQPDAAQPDAPKPDATKPDPDLLAVEFQRRRKEITDRIDELIHAVDEAELAKHKIYLALKEHDDPDLKAEIETVQDARKEANRMIGVLAAQRADMTDGLPVIGEAGKQLRLIVKDLREDAALIERVRQRIDTAVETLGKAEKVITRLLSIVSKVLG